MGLSYSISKPGSISCIEHYQCTPGLTLEESVDDIGGHDVVELVEHQAWPERLPEGCTPGLTVGESVVASVDDIGGHDVFELVEHQAWPERLPVVLQHPIPWCCVWRPSLPDGFLPRLCYLHSPGTLWTGIQSTLGRNSILSYTFKLSCLALWYECHWDQLYSCLRAYRSLHHAHRAVYTVHLYLFDYLVEWGPGGVHELCQFGRCQSPFYVRGGYQMVDAESLLWM